MKIFIPTRGRPYRQISYPEILNAGFSATLVVSKFDDRLSAYERLTSQVENLSLLVVKSRNLGEKRQQILNHVDYSGKILMLDDDLRFYARRRDGNFRIAESADIVKMIRDIDSRLGHSAHLGLCDKFMSQHRPRGEVRSGRYNQVLSYNLDLWPRKFRFSPELLVNAEHDMHLQLSAAGLPPTILCEYSKDAPYYAEGGVSAYRTPAVERRGHKLFVKKWKPLVKLVPAKTPAGVSLRFDWRSIDANRNTDL